MYYLKIEINEKIIDIIELKKRTTIGSNSTNDIILKTKFIKSEHAIISIEKNNIKISAINNSKIFFNGKEQDEIIASLNDVFAIGLTKFTIISSATNNTFVSNSNKYKSYNLSKKNIIGRLPTCDIYIDNNLVSRKHAELFLEKEQYFIKDLNSKNGTYLNNEKISNSHTLKNSDLIQIGKTIFEFKDNILYTIMDKNVSEIIVSGLEAKINNKITFKNININAKSNDLIAVIGGSGEGKTTLLKILAGYIKPTKGLILLNKISLLKNYNFLKNELCYIPQDDILYENLTIYDNMFFTYALRNNNFKDDVDIKINKILNVVGLKNKKNEIIKNLSGGQRKRAAIASEIISEPTILFLDEPTSSLDNRLSNSMISIFRAIANRNKIIFVATHDVSLLDQYDKIIVVNNNEMVFFGTPQQLTNTYKLNNYNEIYNRLANLKNFSNKSYESFVTSISNSQIIQTSNKKLIFVTKKHFLKQLNILNMQYIKIILKSPATLLIWGFQAPIIAIILVLVFKNNLNMLTFSFTLAISTFWYGANNSIREIVKFDKFFIKERHASLNLNSFIFSRFIILSFIGIIETIFFVSIINILLNIEINWATLSVFLIFSSILGTAMGIMISSFSSTSDKALAILPLALIPQLILSGILINYDQMSIVAQAISLITPVKWSFEFTRKLLLWNNGEMLNYSYVFLLFIIIFMVIALFAQRRKDKWTI